MALLGGLIHVFNILETQRLKKFTIYKVQMISFPKNEKLFHCLTKLVVTKRYSDFKKLENDLQTIYKCYNFKRFFKSDSNYFNRFEPEIIDQRKRTILEFLYYCAEHSIIYRSQCFVKFFEDTSSKIESPMLERSETFESSTNESIEEEEDSVDETEAIESETTAIAAHLDEDIDYLYDAALSFSQAVQAEANLKYKNAFDLYKCGIDKLLTGAKNDNNETRKRIAKTKASKYLEKAEQLFENHILKEQENEFLIENSDFEETPSISTLNCPYSNLSRFKVIQINDRIMKVQDRTDKKIYILKVIWKDHSHKVLFLPQNIPYMVRIINYYHSDNAIFLLLPFIPGGLLWNYINSSQSDASEHNSKIEELFVEPPQLPVHITNEISEIKSEQVVEIPDLDEQIEESKNYLEQEKPTAILEQELNIPSFDTLTSDIDVTDLMKCSQNLLKSVTKTLEKSIVLSSEINTEKKSETQQELEEEEEQEIAEEAVEEISAEIIIPKTKSTLIDETEVKQLPELMLKRWASEIIVCINALHKNGIILGDFNLDNVLLGSNGHIMITYFYQRDRSNVQNLCNLNPRAIKCMYVAFDFPLTKASDYYSVGVVLYEILTRHRFYTQHPQGISKFNEIQYPEKCSLSEGAKDLLHSLIIKKSNERPVYDDLKLHPFFDDTNFDEIETFAQK
ncbi:hypothetical protein PVAND_010094 [Polypedilum vanderplanki]|uniref:Uncharacterized protein n=1 Tax=Polypedilum vanderplanki TaxID=319348 RepID=A0A9J6CFA8_POLVA|nr:hypothetical protein PVAND_010094 [Polypedilum vanderplanki]